MLFFWGKQQFEQDHPAQDVVRTFQEAVDRLESIKDDLELSEEIQQTCRDLWIQSMKYLAAKHK